MTDEPEYTCTMDPPKETILQSQSVTLRGYAVKLTSRHLFILEDGSVYVRDAGANRRKGYDYKFTSLDSLIEAAKSTRVIQNFST